MKKSLFITFLISILLTTIICILTFFQSNLTFFTNPDYTVLTKEEKLVVSYCNGQGYLSFDRSGQIVSIQKHHENSYHILLEDKNEFREYCLQSQCQSSFNDGFYHTYDPIYANQYLERDYDKIHELLDSSDANLNLKKINNAIESDPYARYYSVNTLLSSPAPIVFFVIFFIVVAIPTFIIRRKKARNRKTKS